MYCTILEYMDGASSKARRCIRRDDFVNLIGAIERDEIDVVIIRDVDRLTRNLPDWSRFEKAAIEHRVILSAYAGGDLDLSTPEGAYYGGMETLRAKRESAVRSVRVREAHDRIARQGKPSGGGRRWFGYTRVYANPEETVKRKRVILREELNPVEAEALRDAAERILRGETVGSIIREWTQRGIRPSGGEPGGKRLPGRTRSARPGWRACGNGRARRTPRQWPAILDVDTHERLVKLFADPSRRAHVVGRKRHLLSGVARCGKCGQPAVLSRATARTPTGASPGRARAAGASSVNAVLLEEYVTGAVLDALESPRVQEAVRAGRTRARRAARNCWRKSARRRTSAPTRGATGPRTSSTRKTGWTSGSAPTSASPGRARNTTGSAARPPCSATYPRPTWCATRGRTGTPTGSARRSRPS